VVRYCEPAESRRERPQPNMGQQWYRRNTNVLLGLVVLAAGYSGLLHSLGTLTGSGMLDGVISVALGLYICSHPAANAIDLLFLERAALRQVSSAWSGLGWLALNGLVVLVGWLVIATGTTRLVG
jgi:hypothetical protein